MGQRSTLLAALIGAVAVTTTNALAVETKPTASNLLGFDETYVRTLSASDVIPEVRILETFDFNETAVAAEPFVGPDEAAAEKRAEKRFINGADDRYLYSDTNYPYGAIGKLQWSNGVFCSGALVGPRHVLTAKHCLVSGQSGTFSPGFDNGARLGSGAVTTVITSGYEWGTPCGWKGDWAILILDRRLGDERGYFGVKLPERSKVDNPMFHHIGYPGDRDGGNRPYRTNGNTVQGFRAWDCDQYGPFYTDTDCAGGQSGGPHWEVVDGNRYIWGTLSVTFDGGNGVAWSGWGSGEQMLDSVIRARNDFP